MLQHAAQESIWKFGIRKQRGEGIVRTRRKFVNLKNSKFKFLEDQELGFVLSVVAQNPRLIGTKRRGCIIYRRESQRLLVLRDGLEESSNRRRCIKMDFRFIIYFEFSL